MQRKRKLPLICFANAWLLISSVGYGQPIGNDIHIQDRDGVVHAVALRGNVLRPEVLEYLESVKSPFSLDLTFCSFSSDDLNSLWKVVNVESLYLADQSENTSVILDRGFLGISKWTRLRKLFAPCGGLTGDTLLLIGKIESLEEINLSNSEISSDSLKHIQDLKSLSSLALERSNVDDGAVEILLSFKSLKYLNVSRTKISPNGIERLRSELPESCIFIFSSEIKKKTEK